MMNNMTFLKDSSYNNKAFIKSEKHLLKHLKEKKKPIITIIIIVITVTVNSYGFIASYT